jgi:hypothetical protein
MKLFETNKYGNIVPVPDGQEPRDKRWTARAVFVYLIPVVIVVVLVVSWFK